MGVMTSSRMPLPSRQRYSVDVQISVWRHGEEYIAYVQSGGQCYPIEIHLTPFEVRMLNDKIKGSIAKSVLSAQPEVDLRTLAEVGSYAYQKVFSDEKAQRTIQSALSLAGPDGIIQITTDGFALPWDLFYDKDVLPSVSFDGFWGFRYITYRVLVVASRLTDFAPPVIYTQCPSIGLMVDHQLPSVANKEIPFFTHLNEQNKIHLVQLRRLDPNKRPIEMKFFVQFWEKKMDLAHLASHAVADSTPSDSYIEISDGFRISLQDMTVYKVQINNLPLIVLNGCHTGNLDPLYVSNIAGAFIQHGARGVIATECTVPDDLAAEFTIHFYTHLLEGEALGNCLMAARRYLLRKCYSPAGLLYALYAAPNFKISKEKKNA
jgi:hypothetical protein